jgi:hypothetical protein
MHEIHNLYFSQDIIRIADWKRVASVETTGHTGEV